MPNDPLQEAHARALFRVLADEDLNERRKVNVQKEFDTNMETLTARQSLLDVDKDAMFTSLGLDPEIVTETVVDDEGDPLFDGYGNPKRKRLPPQTAATVVWKKLFPGDEPTMMESDG